MCSSSYKKTMCVVCLLGGGLLTCVEYFGEISPSYQFLGSVGGGRWTVDAGRGKRQSRSRLGNNGRGKGIRWFGSGVYKVDIYLVCCCCVITCCMKRSIVL